MASGIIGTVMAPTRPEGAIPHRREMRRRQSRTSERRRAHEKICAVISDIACDGFDGCWINKMNYEERVKAFFYLGLHRVDNSVNDGSAFS